MQPAANWLQEKGKKGEIIQDRGNYCLVQLYRLETSIADSGLL
jgi:hypothetical protein